MPLSIKVHSSETAPVVSTKYAVNIYHWNNKKYKVLAQEMGLNRIIRGQEFNQPLHNKRAITLTWMNASCKNDSFAIINLIKSSLPCNLKQVLAVTTKSFAKLLSDHILTFFLISHKQVKIGSKILVAVWIAIRKENSLILLEIVSEC